MFHGLYDQTVSIRVDCSPKTRRFFETVRVAGPGQSASRPFRGRTLAPVATKTPSHARVCIRQHVRAPEPRRAHARVETRTRFLDLGASEEFERRRRCRQGEDGECVALGEPTCDVDGVKNGAVAHARGASERGAHGRR